MDDTNIVNSINDIMEDNLNNNEELRVLSELPSNNGIESSTSNETGELKIANTVLDPNTGETKILSTEDISEETVDDTSFEQLMDDIDSGKISIETDNSPITEEEIKDNIDTLSAFNLDNNGNYNISDEAMQTLLKVANRRMQLEKFNVYKELPDEIKKMINSTIGAPFEKGYSNALTKETRALRNSIAEQLVDEFILNISIDRAKIDLGKEIENVFKEANKEVAEYALIYTKERNQKYREYVETLEDEDKKQKLLKTLDTIDTAYSLDPLKEYAKTCKIKKYDIEEPKKYFRGFLDKYNESAYNIYDIKLTLPILERHIIDNENYNTADVLAFLVCFCKYSKNFKVENILEHTFMYYVIYNIIMIDSNTSENTKEISDIFIENIKEVINNLKERNSFLK